jgi:hypothetical protein
MANNEETIVLGPGNNNNQNKNVPPRPSVAPQPKAQARPQQPVRPAYQPQNDDQTWKRVAIGGVAGIMFGTVSAVGATAAYHHFANNDDEVEPVIDDTPVMPEEDGHYTMENGLQVAEVSDDMSFSEAFAAARAEVGPGGVFVWHGGVYGTYYETEWNAMSPGERAEFAHLSQPAIEQEAPVHHHHDHVDVVHHHDVNIHNVNLDDDVSIVGVEEVTLADGSTATLAQANVNGHDVYMVDVDQDGVFDVAAMDANNNGQVDDNEIMDISAQGIRTGATPTTVSNEGPDPDVDFGDGGMDGGTDDGLLTDAGLPGDDGMMPDYTNDAGGDLLV